VICEGLRTLLLAQSSITDIVGTSGIYVTAAVQSASLPYIVIDRIRDEIYKGLSGNLSARHCEVDIECWQKKPGTAAALAKIVSDYLDDFSGATGGTETILAVHQVDTTDTFDPPQSGGPIQEFATILTLEIDYTG
jgi:hypothetical protein